LPARWPSLAQSSPSGGAFATLMLTALALTGLAVIRLALVFATG